MIILPLIFWAELFLLFNRKNNLRDALLWSMLLWTVFLVVLLETLSPFRSVNSLCLSLAYATVIVGLGAALSLKRKELRWPSLPAGLVPWERFLAAAIIIIGCLTLASALIAPPNNYDAMTYHMSRVAHWAQNQSLAHYPTGILRQLYMPPAAEYVILLFQVMLGGDRLANLVQWLAMLGSLSVITLIAGRLGLDRKWQLFSAFAAATLPMGIMQASSTQTDYFAGFWVLCFAYFTLSLRKDVSRENMIG